MKLNIQRFAVTFTGKEVTGNYSWAKIQGRVICEETYVGTSAENKSTVKCTVQARVTTGGTTAANWRAGATVGGDAKTGKLTTNTKFTDSWKTIKEFTFDVPHDEDGSKVVTISGYAQAPEYATSLGNAKSTFSGTMTLTTIPRESSISVNKETATLGDTIRVTINRKSSSFSENLAFILNSPDTGSQNVEAVGVSATYYDYVITEETYKYLTGTQGFLTISGTTLDGNDKVVASTNTVSVEILTPDSMKPSVEIGDLYENGTIVHSSWGVFVKGKSEIGVPVTSTGVNGSTIKNISMKDSNDSGVYVINSSSGIFSTNKVKANGTLTITATDTRGKSASKTVEYEVVDYSNPKLTTYTAKKVNSEGAEDDNGQNIMFSIEGTISSCGGNNVKKLYVAVNNQTNWISVADDTVDAVLSDTTIDPNVKNTVYFKIEDGLGGSEIKSVPIDSAFRLMNFNKTLTSVALGKKSSAADNEELFEVNMKSKFYKDIEVTNVVSKNLFNKNNLIDGNRFGSDGSLFAEAGYSATDFIEVEPETYYTRSKTGDFLSVMECFVEYDVNKNFISRKNDGNTIFTTSETKYIRLSVQTKDIDTCQFEIGQVASPCVPYLNLKKLKEDVEVINKYLPSDFTQGPQYTTNYLQLGYIECELLEYQGWSNITLLVSSTFYGVQHCSTHLLTLSQAKYIKTNYTKLGGNDRGFAYKIDETNKRIYIYAYCTGGNGFGFWNTVLMNNINCKWVSEIVYNVAREANWVSIDDINSKVKTLTDRMKYLTNTSAGNTVTINLGNVDGLYRSYAFFLFVAGRDNWSSNLSCLLFIRLNNAGNVGTPALTTIESPYTGTFEASLDSNKNLILSVTSSQQINVGELDCFVIELNTAE